MNTTSIQGELFSSDTEAVPYMLTVKQPWAWAILHADKDVENRSRAINYRGRLLIHAGQRYAPEGDEWLASLGLEAPADLPTGCIIGSVQVVGSTRRSGSRWAMGGFHHWLLEDPQPATTLVSCRGSLGLVRAPEGWERAFTS